MVTPIDLDFEKISGDPGLECLWPRFMVIGIVWGEICCRWPKMYKTNNNNNNNNNNKTNNNNNKLLHLIEIKKLYDCMTCIIHLATLGDFFGMVNWRNKNSKVVGDLQCLGIKRSLWITWSLRTRAILIFFCCKGISECQKYAFQSFQISNSMFLGFTLPKN